MKFSTIIIAVVLFFVSVLNVSAQISGNIEVQNFFLKKEGVSLNAKNPQIAVFVTGPTGIPKINWTSFSVASKSWGETYLGVSYSPTEWISASVSAGIETHEDVWRVAGSLSAGTKKISGFIALEKGGSGFWYKSIVKYNVGIFGFGMHAQKNKGIGPYAEVIPIKNFKIWTSFLVNENQKVGYVTLKYFF